MNEYDEASESLAGTKRRVLEALIAASWYVEAKADDGDPVAQFLADQVRESFTALRAENIAAASLLEGTHHG